MADQLGKFFKLGRIRALRGPNVWGRFTCLQSEFAPADPNGAPLPMLSLSGNAWSDLCRALPSLAVPAHSEGASAAHLYVALALELQRAAGCPVSRCAAIEGQTPHSFTLMVEYSEEEVGRRAFEWAGELLRALFEQRSFDIEEVLTKLRQLDEEIRPGPSTGAVIAAAKARGIPVRRLNEGSLVQFGWGLHARRIIAAESDRTSAIGEAIAKDKELTKALLRSVGVPVPEGQVVRSAEEAWAFARELELPVVLKPRDGNQGRGVSLDLTEREEIEAAFRVARSESEEVMVERFVEGGDYRLLIVDGALVAAARRTPPLVVGDGGHTIAELVEEANRDPRRTEGHATVLSKIRLDEVALAVLAEQRLAPASVPPEGARIALRRNANLSTGGISEDVTDEVHPEVAARAIESAAMVGLDIAGVDVVCVDISKPLEAQGGAIVEVNAGPGLRMHIAPSVGRARPVGEAIIESLFPKGENGRIPVVAVTGTNGKTTTVRLIAHLLGSAGKTVGMTCTDGIYVNGRRIDTGDCAGPKSARGVLQHPHVEAAVFEVARGGLLREGLGFDRCDVAVVTNIGKGDHLGMGGIETAEQLARVKRLVVEAVPEEGSAVLNAADPLALAMSKHCKGRVILFACDPKEPALAAWRAKNGRCLYLSGGAIVAAEGRRTRELMPLSSVPLTLRGMVRFQVENVLASVGAAWALGLSADAARRGLGNFVSDIASTPGRFNLLESDGAQIVIDYGHNGDALEALLEALDGFGATKRRVVISAAGDRRDQDLERLGELVGGAFDEVLLFEDVCIRGRPDGEVFRLMAKGVERGGRAKSVLKIQGEFRAIEEAFARLGKRELLLLLVDQVDEALALIERLVRDRDARRVLNEGGALRKRPSAKGRLVSKARR